MSGSLLPTLVLPQRALRCKIMVKDTFRIYTFIIYALPFISLGSVRFYVFKRSLLC